MPSPCEDAQNRFSSFWEKALSPSEETEVLRHLDACPSCQEAYRRFELTLRMLHSMDEEDAPDGLLEGVYEKLEERKGTLRKASPASIRPSSSWRLPVQALAMVTLVFLALYLTQNRPVDLSPKRGSVSSESLLSSGEKTARVEEKQPPKDGLKGGRPLIDPRPDPKGSSAPDVRTPKATKESGVKKAGPIAPAGKKDAVPAPPPAPAPLREKQDAAEPPADPMEQKAEERPPREITVKARDPKEAAAQIQELIKRFQGEILSSGPEIVLAAVPGPALTAFCEELARIERPPEKLETSVQGKSPAVKDEDSIGEGGARKRKGKPSSRGAARRGEPVSIRILIQPIPSEN